MLKLIVDMVMEFLQLLWSVVFFQQPHHKPATVSVSLPYAGIIVNTKTGCMHAGLLPIILNLIVFLSPLIMYHLVLILGAENFVWISWGRRRIWSTAPFTLIEFDCEISLHHHICLVWWVRSDCWISLVVCVIRIQQMLA